MSEVCCNSFKMRGRWLFTAARASGSPTPSFCPWCGKGVTAAPTVGRTPFFPTSVPARGAVSAFTKGWPKGRSDCPNCRGLGYTLKREGCCKLIPVPCACTQDQVPGNPANTGGQA